MAELILLKDLLLTFPSLDYPFAHSEGPRRSAFQKVCSELVMAPSDGPNIVCCMLWVQTGLYDPPSGTCAPRTCGSRLEPTLKSLAIGYQALVRLCVLNGSYKSASSQTGILTRFLGE